MKFFLKNKKGIPTQEEKTSSRVMTFIQTVVMASVIYFMYF